MHWSLRKAWGKYVQSHTYTEGKNSKPSSSILEGGTIKSTGKKPDIWRILVLTEILTEIPSLVCFSHYLFHIRCSGDTISRSDGEAEAHGTHHSSSKDWPKAVSFCARRAQSVRCGQRNYSKGTSIKDPAHFNYLTNVHFARQDFTQYYGAISSFDKLQSTLYNFIKDIFL